MATTTPNHRTAAVSQSSQSSLATASFVLGICAALGAVFLFPGVILGVIALGLGIAGRSEVRRNGNSNMWAATIGIVLSVLALVYVAVMTAIVV